MVAAKHTFIDHMLLCNNFENYYRHLSRYPEVEFSRDDSKSPEVVLLSSEPYPFKAKHKTELSTFFPGSTILLVDGEMFSWYGSRLVKAFDYFRTLHETHLAV